MNAPEMARTVGKLFLSELRDVIEHSQSEHLTERLMDLHTQYVAYWTAVQAGAGPPAEKELNHIRAIIGLILARETVETQARAFGFLEGALKLAVLL